MYTLINAHLHDNIGTMIVYECVYMYVCMYVCVCIYVCMICMYVCMYVCMYRAGRYTGIIVAPR